MYIRVHVFPKAKKELVTRKSETEYTVSVREPRERNLANTRVRAVIASVFHVPVAKVSILTGHRSTTKVLNVEL
jgi:uncharacterized protein YggU (UPF0235/DUF167 family)